MKKTLILLLLLRMMASAPAQTNTDLWLMINEHYSRFDSIGCEWSNWEEDGLVFSWFSNNSCQLARYRDKLRITIYGYHPRPDSLLCIVLLDNQRYHLFVATNEKNGEYYKLDSTGQSLPLAFLPPSHRFSVLGSNDRRKFNRTISRVIKMISLHTLAIRD